MTRIEGSAVQLILADHDIDWLMETAQELSSHSQLKVVGFAQDGDTLVEHVINMDADAVLMDFTIPGSSAGEIARKLADDSPDTAVFAVTDSITMQLKETAKSDGVIDVYDKDKADINQIANQITYYVDAMRRNYGEVSRMHNEDIERASGPARTISQSIISTYNIKGGVGKTTLAVNLATAIKMSPYLSGLRVCLVDFDCGGANAATNCHLDDLDVINRNLVVWEHLPEDISGADVEELLIKGPQGLMIAAAPINQASSERVTAELAEKIIRILKRHFTIIVIDGAPNITAPMDVAFSHSTHILMIANAEGQSVKQLSRTVQLFSPDPDYPEKQDMSHILDKMFLILNYAHPLGKWDLKKSEISKNVGKPIFGEIPYDDVIRRALHSSNGKVAVELEPNGEFATAIKSLANDICGAYPGRKPKKKNMLGKIFKKRR